MIDETIIQHLSSLCEGKTEKEQIACLYLIKNLLEDHVDRKFILDIDKDTFDVLLEQDFPETILEDAPANSSGVGASPSPPAEPTAVSTNVPTKKIKKFPLKRYSDLKV